MASIRTTFGNLLGQGRSLGERSGKYNWYLFDQVVVSGANFLTSVVVARFLGIETFGVFSLAWMMVQFIQSVQFALVLLPMMSIGPKQKPEDVKSYFAVAMVHQLAWALASALLVYVGCLIAGVAGLGVEAQRLAAPLFAAVLVTQMHEFLRRYNFTRGDVERVFISDVVRYGSLIAILIASALAAQAKPDSGAVLYLITLSAGIATLMLLPTAPSIRGFGARFGEITSRHLRLSRWLAGSALLMWVTSNFFAVAAGSVLGPAAVGAVRATQSLMAVTNLFFQAAEGFAPPKAASIYHTDGLAGLRRFVSQLTMFGLVITVVACVLLAVPAQFWLTLVFGPDYGRYGYAVVGFALSYILLAYTVPLRYAFQAVEKTRVDFTSYIFASVWTLATSYPAAQMFGLYGAIGGYLVGQAIMLVNLHFAYQRLVSEKE